MQKSYLFHEKLSDCQKNALLCQIQEVATTSTPQYLYGHDFRIVSGLLAYRKMAQKLFHFSRQQSKIDLF